MNSKIEIHDSRVVEIETREGEVIVHFRRAYIHKSEGRPGLDPGAGWAQEASLVFAEASVSGPLPEWPCDMMDGDLVLDGERHANSIPVPLDVKGPVELRLVCDSIHTVTVTGRGVRLELMGEPKYVEEFSPL